MKAAVLLALLALVACKKSAEAVDSGAGASPEAPPAASATPAPRVAAARCRPEGESHVVATGDDMDMGDTLAFGDGYALGLVHRTAAGRVAAVALLGKSLASPRVVDLGPTSGDAPAPRLALRGGDLLVGRYTLPKKSGARELAVETVSPSGAVVPVATVAQQRDDSFAFDLAPGMVVWDEAVPGKTPRGVIRVATLAPDHPPVARDLSPPDSDAEAPRVVPWPDGKNVVVAWIARRSDPAAVLDAAASDEVTGEERTQSWIEAATVDASGALVGPVRRVTPQTGHVSAFDVALLRGSARPAVLLVARDDGEAVDGSGGVLLRARLRQDGVDPAGSLPGDGLGRGAPTLVDSAPPWVSWVGPAEEVRLLAFDAEGNPVGPPTAEPALDEARPLVDEGRADHLLVAFPAAAEATVRSYACSRE